MKPFVGVLIFFFVLHLANGQNVDTVIVTPIYKSYFSYALKQPLYVTYHLFKGGGNCKRKGMDFEDEDNDNFAKGEDYKGSHLEKGHLANAEDFAFDCKKLKETFHYYNCVPQTLKLNRGSWKKWEKKVRDLSKTQKLFVIAGNIYGNKTIGEHHVGVPDSCYKIVLNAATKQVKLCLIFANNNSNTVQPIDLAALKKRLKYPLVP